MFVLRRDTSGGKGPQNAWGSSRKTIRCPMTNETTTQHVLSISTIGADIFPAWCSRWGLPFWGSRDLGHHRFRPSLSGLFNVPNGCYVSATAFNWLRSFDLRKGFPKPLHKLKVVFRPPTVLHRVHQSIPDTISPSEFRLKHLPAVSILPRHGPQTTANCWSNLARRSL